MFLKKNSLRFFYQNLLIDPCKRVAFGGMIVKMRKKYVLPVLCFGWVCLGANLVGDPGPYVINSLQNTTQTWEIDAENPDKNTVTFAEDGAVSVETTEDIPAAINVSYPGKDAAAENGLLTLNFQNEPKIDGNSEQENIGSAHIFSYGKNNNATALHLADGVNLNFTGDTENLYKTAEKPEEQKRVGIFAHSESENWYRMAVGIELEGKAEGEPPSTEGFDQTLTFTVPVKICVQSAGGYCNAAAAIGKGKALTHGSMLLNGSIKYDIENNNILSVFSSSPSCLMNGGYPPSSASYSVGVVVGVASSNCNDVIVSGNNEYKIGNYNALKISSSSSCHASTYGSNSRSSGVVIGASSDAGNVSMIGNNRYEIANNNTLNVVSSSSSSGGNPDSISSGVVIGIGISSGFGSVKAESGVLYAIGEDNDLSAFSSSDSDGASSYSYSSAVAIGASAGRASNDDVNVSGNSRYAIGNNNIFNATSRSHATGNSHCSYSSAVVLGVSAGYACNSSVNIGDSQEITINNNNKLLSLAMATNSVGSGYSASGVFGAACSGQFGDSRGLLDEVASAAKGMSINLNGSQTMSALAYSSVANHIKVSVFGADDTDKTDEDKYGWRVGIYNEEEAPAVVNILGAKLEEEVVFSDDDKVTVVLGADQGRVRTEEDGDNFFGNNDYARSFALGKDFQIYIGGKDVITRDPDSGEITSHQFEGVQAGNGNVANIFGAIAPAQYAVLSDEGRCPDSSFTVDSGWTVNAFSPFEGLESVIVKGNGVLNTYNSVSSIKNITLDGGIVKLCGKTDGVGEIILKGGAIKVGNHADIDSEIDSALQLISDKLQIANPQKEGKLCKVTIKDNAYKGTLDGQGVLQLNEGDIVECHVDTSMDDPNVSASGNNFKLVKGCIEIEGGSGSCGKINFKGGRFKLVDDAEQPDSSVAAFLFVRFPGLDVSDILDGDNIFDPVADNEGVYQLNGGTLLTDDSGINVNGDMKIYAKDKVGIGLMKLDELESVTDVALTTPEEDVSTETSGGSGVSLSGELAETDMAAGAMFRGAVAARLTDVKGNGNDPFISVIGGRIRRSEVSGVWYDGDLYGVAAGGDKLINLQSGAYMRLGGMLGYVRGDIDFHGSAVDNKRSVKQDNYLLSVYSAYESFNENGLKTDFNLSLGYGYGEHRLSRLDAQNNSFSAKMKSDNLFISGELVKNLYAIQGVQIGFWLKADYNHIRQKGYSEHAANGGTAQSVSKANFDSLDTIVGVNIEKDLQNQYNPNRRTRFYAKAGWNCQPARSHSTILAGVYGQMDETNPSLKPHNAAVFVAGCRQKLNANWDIITEWNGSFSKKHSYNLVTFSVGYTF